MHTHPDEKITASWLKEAQKGYIRVAVLILLNKKPSHGYELMKDINSRTKGFWKPTPGGVYPILRNLEKARYIKGEWYNQGNRRIKSYKITETGTQILKSALIKQNEIANNMNSLFEEFSRDVLEVETSTVAIPTMKSPFAAFLEEEEKSRDETIEKLEQQQKHVKEDIRMLRKMLLDINQQIAKAKEEKEDMD